jgi:uncharacterized membrane protein
VLTIKGSHHMAKKGKKKELEIELLEIPTSDVVVTNTSIVNVKPIVDDLLTENPQGPYQISYASLGSVGGAMVGAAIGSFILPGIGTAAGALMGGAIGGLAGFQYGKYKWNNQLKNVEQNQTLADINNTVNTLTTLKEDCSPSFVERIPYIGNLYTGGQWLFKQGAKKLKKYKEELMVADLTGGVGFAIGYQIGLVIGSIIAPGLGTILGGVVGGVVGLVAGTILGAQSSHLLKSRFNVDYKKQRIAAAGAIAGAALGAALGGLVGSFVPGLGTAIGAAVGAAAGAVIGAVYGVVSYNRSLNQTKKSSEEFVSSGSTDQETDKSFLNKFSSLFTMGPGISCGAIIGGIAGSIFPGIGTALGAAIGAVIGASITWCVATYGQHLRDVAEEKRNTIRKNICKDILDANEENNDLVSALKEHFASFPLMTTDTSEPNQEIPSSSSYGNVLKATTSNTQNPTPIEHQSPSSPALPIHDAQGKQPSTGIQPFPQNHPLHIQRKLNSHLKKNHEDKQKILTSDNPSTPKDTHTPSPN